MKYIVALAFVLACAGSAMATETPQHEDGQVVVSASASNYVDVSIGGATSLTGDVNGSINGTETSGAELNLTVDLGTVDPSNTNDFVVAKIPLRLQSNVGYELQLQATQPTPVNSTDLATSDIAFGLGDPDRDSDDGVAAGTDTVTSAVSGDPSEDTEANAGGRWDWAAGRALDSFASASTVLSGDRIMDVVPNGDIGLRVDSYLVIKPQFYTESDIETTLTFTIAPAS